MQLAKIPPDIQAVSILPKKDISILDFCLHKGSLRFHEEIPLLQVSFAIYLFLQSFSFLKIFSALSQNECDTWEIWAISKAP